MAIKLKKSSSITVADMLSTYKKDMGEEIGDYGGLLRNRERIPTGLFELDLALGGGFPRGKASMIFGPESSNKTNVALRAISFHQKLWPNLTCIFVDLENEYNPEWATALGVNTEKLLVVNPSYAEQAIDMVEGFIAASDCSLIVLDSIASLVSKGELDKSAEGENPGAAGRIMSKLYRKTVMALTQAEKENRHPTLIYINQIIYKIGVMFGNPETTPGGKKPWFQSSLIIRLYGKNIIDQKVSKIMPVAKEVNFVVNKFKVPILSVSGRFEMVTMAHDIYKVGQCKDHTTIKEYLQAFGEFASDGKKGWNIMQRHYDKQSEFFSRLYKDETFGHEVRQHIITKLLSGELVEPEGSGDDESLS